MQQLFKKTAKATLLLGAMTLLTGMQPRLGGFNDRLLASHNRERELMGVPAMRWNDDLAQGAQAWADHLSQTGKFEHSPNTPGRALEGENIWGGTPGAFRPESMIDLWIAEKAHFIPGIFPANSRTGRPQDVAHYTQLIWRGSLEVGCGLSGEGAEEILVCRYSAPGNIRGRDPFGNYQKTKLVLATDGQSIFSLPPASSAAGFANVSSTLSFAAGAASKGAVDALVPDRLPTSSAMIREGGGERPAAGEDMVKFASKSAMASICGLLSSNCSWLID